MEQTLFMSHICVKRMNEKKKCIKFLLRVANEENNVQIEVKKKKKAPAWQQLFCSQHIHHQVEREIKGYQAAVSVS